MMALLMGNVACCVDYLLRINLHREVVGRAAEVASEWITLASLWFIYAEIYIILAPWMHFTLLSVEVAQEECCH